MYFNNQKQNNILNNKISNIKLQEKQTIDHTCIKKYHCVINYKNIIITNLYSNLIKINI